MGGCCVFLQVLDVALVLALVLTLVPITLRKVPSVRVL